MNRYLAHAGHVHGDEATAPLDAETLAVTVIILIVVLAGIAALRRWDKKRATRED